MRLKLGNRDARTIRDADERGTVMVFTGPRLFHHWGMAARHVAVWRGVLGILMLAGLSSARLMPADINLLWEHKLLAVFPIDVNGDSVDELLTLASDFYVVAYDQNFDVASGSRVFKEGTLSRGASAGGINGDTVWVSYDRGDSAFVYDLWPRREISVAGGRSLVAPDWWDGAIRQVELHDLGGDGRKELVVSVAVGFDLQPRGIFAIDWATGKRLWYYEMGPNPSNFLVGDVDNDGKPEVIVGSLAPGNRPPGYDPPDTLTYVACVGGDGREKWRRDIGSYGQEAQVAWFGKTAAGTPQVLVVERGCAIPGAQPDSLFVLDASNGGCVLSAQYGQLNASCVGFSDRAGQPRLALTGRDDTMRILDNKLRLVREIPLTGGYGTAVYVGRFTDSLHDQLLVQVSNGRAIIFDSKWRPIAESLVGDGDLRVLRHKRRSVLLAGPTSDQTRTYRLYEIRVSPVLSRRVALGWFLSILTAALMVPILVSFAYRYRHLRDIRTIIRGLTGAAGVLELDRRGNVRRSNPRGRELLLAAGATESTPLSGSLASLASSTAEGRAARELPLSLSTGQTVLARATPVESGTLLTLEDISAVEYMKRVTSWAPAAQKLAHDIKNPLTAMALTLQRLDKYRTPETERYYTSLRDEIDRLKKMADGFMRLSKLEPPKLVSTAINEVVRQCASKFEGVRPADVELRYDLAEGLPLVALDRDQMAVACSNIIENAISAIVDSGTITIRTSYIVEGKKVEAVVQDTGKGIPERYLDEVCEPFFALKPGGTGLGMAITKRIIEDHKGTIRVESKEGAGTTVTITLPAG